jgi:hypothetical protein
MTHTTKSTLPEAIFAHKETSNTRRTLLRFAAGIGLHGGTCILFGAIFLTVFEYFYSEKLHGNWVFLAVLPLWIIGALCLDKLEFAEKARRIEYCKEIGMKDRVFRQTNKLKTESVIKSV